MRQPVASSLDERAYLRAVELVSLAKAFSQHLNSERTRVFLDPRELREVIGMLKSTAHAVPEEVDALRERLPDTLRPAFLEVAAQARREQES